MSDDTLVYSHRNSRVSHVLDEIDSPNGDAPALCGERPLRDWLGTGNQTERDRAERLVACRNCKRVLEAREDARAHIALGRSRSR